MYPSRKAIYRQLFFLAILFLVLSAGFLFYNGRLLDRIFRDITRNSLKTTSALIAARIDPVAPLSPLHLKRDLDPFAKASDARVTVIAPDGTVLYDSEKRQDEMENHLDRPEIASALKSGDGYAERYSNTLGANLVYFARRLDAGETPRAVIRVSRASFVVHHLFDPYKYEILAGTIGALFCIALFFLIQIHRISRKAAAVAEAATSMTLGNYEITIQTKEDDLFYPMFLSLAKLGRTIQQLIDDVNERNQLLSEVVWEIPVPIVIFSASGIIRFKTRAFEEIRLSTDTIDEVMNTLRISELTMQVSCLRQSGSEFALETEWSKHHYHVRGLPLKTLQETLYMIIFFDISEIRLAEQMKADFTANASHELKTPLTVIKGFVETLAEEIPSGHEFMLDIIRKNIDRLERLVADILLLSQVEAEKILMREPVELTGLVKTAFKLFENEAAKRGITMHLDSESPVFVAGDEFLLAQLVTNLLSNAVKFNRDNGRVNVSVRDAGEDIVLDVSDTGIGIPREHLSRIFQRFYVVDRSRSRELGGTGLGLSIVRHVAELHGGTVEVRSGHDQGTIFTICIPKPA